MGARGNAAVAFRLLSGVPAAASQQAVPDNEKGAKGWIVSGLLAQDKTAP